jgi:hypothetical protein
MIEIIKPQASLDVWGFLFGISPLDRIGLGTYEGVLGVLKFLKLLSLDSYWDELLGISK